MADTRRSEPALPADSAIRELMVVREIAHAFLTADRPEDVFQFALDRVSPLVGASFASIYLDDEDGEAMRLAAAYNWPERYRPFLGDMRVRVGLGPSGEAVSERRVVRVPDVFADDSVADWRDVASELGFRALVAIPLATHGKVLGALTFYFGEPGEPGALASGLLQIVADQLAATAEKAGLIVDLRRSNAALLDSNAELERQYLAALEARRIKDEFLSNMSHELRTPLTAVLGYTYLLQEGLDGPVTPEQRRTLTQVTTCGEQLLGLIDDLLELTTLKRGELVVTPEVFDPREAVHDAVERARGRAELVAVRIELPDVAIPRMYSDRAKVVKIVTNLLGNAYKFTTQGEVCVSLEVDDGIARVRVTDTGIGIAPESQAVVFEEFRQADGSSRRSFRGSGLGLALSRQLARLLGGDVALRSAVGQGSTFTLELPLSYEPELSALDAPPSLAVPPAGMTGLTHASRA